MKKRGYEKDDLAGFGCGERSLRDKYIGGGKRHTVVCHMAGGSGGFPSRFLAFRRRALAEAADGVAASSFDLHDPGGFGLRSLHGGRAFALW